MKKTLFRAGALAGVGALVVSSLFMTATEAEADAGDGTLIVNVIDQYGHPVPGFVEVMGSDGSTFGDESAGTAATGRHVLTVPSSGYGVESITVWGGVECAGLSSCAPTGGAPVVTPVATVIAGQTTTYTFHSTVPSITGARKVGSKLTLHIPRGLAVLQSFIESQYPGPITQHWRRGGVSISRATGASYTTVPADGSRAVTALLTPSKGQGVVFSQLGLAPLPFTTNAIKVAKFVPVKTKTEVKVPKRFQRSEPVTMTVKVKPKSKTKAKGLVLGGSVVVKIGKFKARKKLHHGRVFVNLPRLTVGRHTIKAAYTGSKYFVKSKTKVTVLTTR